jgi:hypothetical protein
MSGNLTIEISLPPALGGGVTEHGILGQGMMTPVFVRSSPGPDLFTTGASYVVGSGIIPEPSTLALFSAAFGLMGLGRVVKAALLRYV